MRSSRNRSFQKILIYLTKGISRRHHTPETDLIEKRFWITPWESGETWPRRWSPVSTAITLEKTSILLRKWHSLGSEISLGASPRVRIICSCDSSDPWRVRGEHWSFWGSHSPRWRERDVFWKQRLQCKRERPRSGTCVLASTFVITWGFRIIWILQCRVSESCSFVPYPFSGSWY